MQVATKMKIIDSKLIGHTYQKIQIGSSWVSMGLQFVGFLTFVKVWQSTIEFYHLPFFPILIGSPIIAIIAEFLIGHIQIKSKVMSEMNSMMNLEGNPEAKESIETVRRIDKKVDEIIERMK